MAWMQIFNIVKKSWFYQINLKIGCNFNVKNSNGAFQRTWTPKAKNKEQKMISGI